VHIAIRDTLPEAPFGLRFPQSVKSDFFAGGLYFGVSSANSRPIGPFDIRKRRRAIG
jgi:hypothetical protein